MYVDEPQTTLICHIKHFNNFFLVIHATPPFFNLL
nr:MAG TPA: hypothetical protein [Caudoviricetes sp.]DAL77476.1 MAG TPA: hypothetical protein [Caudoviricetes sp.]